MNDIRRYVVDIVLALALAFLLVLHYVNGADISKAMFIPVLYVIGTIVRIRQIERRKNNQPWHKLV